MDQEDRGDQEGQATLSEDQMAQEQYPPLILFPSNLLEILNPPE